MELLTKAVDPLKTETEATEFKEHCEKNEKALKQAICVTQALAVFGFVERFWK